MVKIRGILNARKINVLAREQGQSYIKSNLQFFLLSVCGAMTRFRHEIRHSYVIMTGQVSVLQLKVSLSFLIVPKIVSIVSCIAGKSGTGERFCFRYSKLLRNIFLKPCLVKAFLTGQDVCSQSTIILGSSLQINQQITKRSFYSLFVLI